MRAQSLRALLVLDLKNTFRDKMAVGFLLVFPVGLYCFFGTFFGANATAESANRYYSQYTINFASAILLNIAFLNVGPTIVLAKDMGFLRRLFVTPLTLVEMWLSTVLRTLAIFALGYASLLFSGWLLLGHLPQASVPQLLVPALVSAFTMLSLGFLLGAIFRKPMAAFNAGMVLIQPMLLLSGAGLPADTFPRWAVALSEALPFTHVVRIMRLGWEDHYFSAAAVTPTLILLATGAACALLATRIFRQDLN
ncbi:ABC transporter permease [Massilia arenosa]|uniref:Transport permease protein n=1 Tax=Zemynaea arenosa TaxID=2561931 RepID=A0A4Y9S6B5_9BURK|nr:ABC transporter permease [Massilia arenosa]TFW16938.1 ABC transporter permease [Massilia arenosa]